MSDTLKQKLRLCEDCFYSNNGMCNMSCHEGNSWRLKKQKLINKSKEIQTKINHPEHYTQNGIEVIDIIEAFELGFCDGNAIKYILRAGRKTNDRLQDLKKAQWYINRMICYLEKENKQ